MNKITKTAVSMVLVIAVAVCSFAMNVGASDSDHQVILMTISQFMSNRPDYLDYNHYNGTFPSILNGSKEDMHKKLEKHNAMKDDHTLEECLEPLKMTSTGMIYTYKVSVVWNAKNPNLYSESLVRDEYYFLNKPVKILNNGDMVTQEGTQGLVYRYSGDGKLNQEIKTGGSILQYPKFGSKVAPLYIVHSGVAIDENGGEVSFDPEPVEIFDKAVYTLSEYNKLLKEKGYEENQLTIPEKKGYPLSYYQFDKLSGLGVKISGSMDTSEVLINAKYKACYNFLKAEAPGHQRDYFYTNYYVVDKNLNAVHTETYSDVPLWFALNAGYGNGTITGTNRASVSVPFNKTYATTMFQQGDKEARLIVSHLTLQNNLFNGNYFEEKEFTRQILSQGHVYVTIPTEMDSKAEGSDVGVNVGDDSDSSNDGEGGYTDLNGNTPTDIGGLPIDKNNPMSFFEWLNSLVTGIGSLFKNFTNFFTTISSSCGEFFGFLSKSFSFLPAEVWTLLLIGVSVVIILRILGR